MAKKLKIMGGAPASVPSSTILDLPVEKLRPSPTNRTIDTTDPAFLELAESIRVQGVHTNLIVRALFDEEGNDTGLYQIVAGERRWRAAQVAERATVPCTVKTDMSDDLSLEIQFTENFHRTDLTPLQKASHLHQMKLRGLSNKEIGARLGIQEKRVSDLLVQLNLIAEAQPLYSNGFMSTALVLYVARLTPTVQENAVRYIFHAAQPEKYSGTFPYAADLRAKVPFADLVAMIAALDKSEAKPVSERALRDWIRENVNLKLADAPWKLDDAELFPDAGPCTTCPQRSTNDPERYAEVSGGKDLCMTPVCYATKGRLLVQIKKADHKVKVVAAKEEGKEVKKQVRLSTKETHTAHEEGFTGTLKKNQWVAAPNGVCNGIATGLMVDGAQAGKEQRVCTDPTCKVHAHNGLWNSRNLTPRGESDEEKAAREAAEAERKAAIAAHYDERQLLVDSALALQPSTTQALRLMLSETGEWNGYQNKAWKAVETLLKWNVPAEYGKRRAYFLHQFATMDEADLSLCVVMYQLADHVERRDHIGHDVTEFRNKLALLGFTEEQLASLGPIPGAGTDEDEDGDYNNDDDNEDDDDNNEPDDSPVDEDGEDTDKEDGDDSPASAPDDDDEAGRRSLTPEQRQNILAAQQARWSKLRKSTAVQQNTEGTVQ